MPFLQSILQSRSIILSSGILFLFALNAISLFAQEPPLLQWGQTYGGEYWEKGYGGTPTDDGGFVIVGYTESFGAGDADLYLARIDKFGDTLWTRTYGGEGLDEGYAIEQTAEDKGLIVAGTRTASLNDDVGNAWILRTDKNGDTLWTYVWKASNIIYQANTVRETPTGDFVVVGTALKNGSPTVEAWIAMMNPDGTPLWSKTFSAENGAAFLSVDFTADNNLVVAGFVDHSTEGNLDAWLVQMNATGDTLWTRTFGGANGDVFSWVRQKPDGSFLCVGTTNSLGEGESDFFVVQFNPLSSGPDSLQLHTYGGFGQDFGSGATLTVDGGFAIVGTSQSFGAEGFDIVVLKADRRGNLQWFTRYGGREGEEGNGILLTDEEGYWIVGSTESFTPTGSASDAWLLRTEFDQVTTVSAQEITTGGSILNEPSPNPFSSSTLIGWHVEKRGNVEITVEDALGRTVRTLLAEVLSPGTYSTEWNGDDANGKALPSGTYFCTMNLDGQLLASKTVLLKR